MHQHNAAISRTGSLAEYSWTCFKHHVFTNPPICQTNRRSLSLWPEQKRITPKIRPLAKQTDQTQPAFSFATLTEWQLWGVVGLFTLAYFIFSFFSDGFYQHDEAAHFISMRRFWIDPNTALGNWAKPGYKLIYALPSLLGSDFVTFTNCLFGGLTIYFSYKIADELDLRIPALTIPLLALQPFWIQLVFRNYSEIISALLLVIAVWFQVRKKPILAALVLSYLTMIRQEFYLLIVIYGVYLLIQKEWVPFLLLGVGPIANNLWGWAATGDWMYILSSVLDTGSRYSSAYPRKGFDHYFLMSVVIFGPVVVSGLVYTVGLYAKKLAKPNWFVATPFLFFFGIHVLFNTQFLDIGAATGGNLRYMLVIAPLGAIIANQGLEQWRHLKSDTLLKVVMGLLVALVGIYMTYDHNNINFVQQRNWVPLIAVAAVVALMLLVSDAKWLTSGLIAVLLIFLPLRVQPFERSVEDRTVAQVAEWAKETNAMQRPILSSHTMFVYFMGRTREEYPRGNLKITKQSVAEAPKGTLIFWDSHYSYRPNLREGTLNYTYFTERPDQFRLIRQFMSPNKRFGILVFEKTTGGQALEESGEGAGD